MRSKHDYPYIGFCKYLLWTADFAIDVCTGWEGGVGGGWGRCMCVSVSVWVGGGGGCQ